MFSRVARSSCSCLCRTTPRSVPAAAGPTAAALSRTFSSSRALSDAPLPWFVDPLEQPADSVTAPKLATAPTPTEPPSHLATTLHPLHSHLSVSPFLDKHSITYINAREADPESTWVDWVVIATLRKGREAGLRGAIEGVRSFLATSPIDLSPSPPASAFAPPSSSPLITGLPTPPSKHARSRQASPSRAEQASGWAMLDAGNVVVHLMATPEARETWGIEEMWRKIKVEGDKERDLVRKMLEGEEVDESQLVAKEEQEGEGYEELSEAELKVIREREGRKVFAE